MVESTYKELTEEFATNIFEKYEVAVGTAREKAKEISVHWGSTVNRQDRSQGGVHFSTYKAICRRSGIYTGGSTGAHDWNGQLMEPLIQHIAAGWEKNFTRRVPAVMQGLARNSNNLLRLFHRDVAQRAQTTGTGLAGLNMLEQQLQNYDEMFKDLAGTSKDNINKEQREINREFVPIIQNALLQAYTSSAEERGKYYQALSRFRISLPNIFNLITGRGSFARMKGHVVGHIEHQRHQMFQDSCDHVRILLRKVLRGVEELMENKAEEVFQMMKLDYCAVLGGGVDIPQGQVAPRWQREMRGSVMKLINSAEKIFKRVAGIEVEDDENVDDAAVDDAMAIEQPEEESAVDTYAVDEFAVVESSKVIEEADSVQGSDGSADLERESAIADGGKARVIPEHPVADDSDDELLGPNDIIQAILNKTSSLKRTTTTESAKVVPAADQDAAPKLMESKVNSPALLSADIHGATTDLVRHNDSVPPSPHPGEYSESAPEDSEPAHGRWDAYDESTEESESDQDHDKMDTQEEFLSSYEDNDE